MKLLNCTRSGLQLQVVSIGSSLLYAPFGCVHTFSDLLYIFPSFYLIPSFQPLYLFLYMLPTSCSVSLSVVPIILTESKSTLYLFTYCFVSSSYITFITVVLTTIEAKELRMDCLEGWDLSQFLFVINASGKCLFYFSDTWACLKWLNDPSKNLLERAHCETRGGVNNNINFITKWCYFQCLMLPFQHLM